MARSSSSATTATRSSAEAMLYVRSFAIDGFLASLLKKIFNPGSTIPIKFRLDDANGQPISTSEAEALVSACGVQIFFSGGSSSPGCARYEDGFFHFNLKTQRTLPPGTYTVTAKVVIGGVVVNTELGEVAIGGTTR
jgi:hypothetical protein